MRGFGLWCFLVVGGFALPAGAVSVDPRNDYDLEHVDLDLRVDLRTFQIQGTAALTVTATDFLKRMVVDLSSDLSADSAWTRAGEVEVSPGQGDQIDLILPEVIESDRRDTVYLRYGGHPPDIGGHAFFETHPESPELITASSPDLPGEAHTWWPTKDTPDDKATVRFRITAPTGLFALGPGLLLGRTDHDDGTTTTEYSSQIPMPPYLLAFTLSGGESWQESYSSVESGKILPLEFHALSEDLSRARELWSILGRSQTGILATLESAFGPYPFEPETVVGRERRFPPSRLIAGTEPLRISEGFRCDIASGQAFLRLGQCTLTDQEATDKALIHEVTGQWFGASMTPRGPEDLWIGEAMARYAEALVAERVVGPGGYLQRMEESADFDPSLPLVPHDLTWRQVEDDSTLKQTMGSKGAWVLHTLRWVLRQETSTARSWSRPDPAETGNDAAFFRVLKSVAQSDRFRWGNLTTAGLVRYVEESIPLDLQWFFAPWLYGTGRPQLTYDWSAAGAGVGANIHLHLEQTQAGPLYPAGPPYPISPDFFPMYWPIRMLGPGGQATDVVIRQTERAQDFDLEAPHPVRDLLVDPDHWIQRELTPLPPSARPFELLRAWPNPAVGSVQVTYRIAAPGPVALVVCDFLGRRVRLLLRADRPAGVHTIRWDGRADGGQAAPQGVYFIRGANQGRADVLRLALLR